MLSDRASWINEHLLGLQMEWEAQGHRVTWAHSTDDALRVNRNPLGQKDTAPCLRMCFCLSFGEVVTVEFRSQFDHTLVVHESDLPQGKGWSPLTWQILEGKSKIPVTLIEAEDRVDSGVIYAQHWLEFQSHELIDEVREGQAHATHDLCRWFVDHYPESVAAGKVQKGEERFYERRSPKDSELDPNKALAEQFDMLRFVDNERYPAFFGLRGQQYRLNITKK
jgi:methionyl-tRNA formyltransferase